MARYISSPLVKMLRERRGVPREVVLNRIAENRVLDITSLARIEGGKINPNQDTLILIMKSIDISLEGFVTYKLDNQRMKAYLLRDYLSQVLGLGDYELAESALARLKAMEGFDNGVYRQFICSKEAQLLEQLGKPASEIRPLIDEGMAITFGNSNENCIDVKALNLEELELLHTSARLYAKDGDVESAIKILSGMKTNLAKLLMTDREKKGQLTPALLSLSGYLMQAGDHEGVLEACALGAEYSAKFMQGRHNPDFEFYNALALNDSGLATECLPHLQNSYYSFMLIGETEKAQNVLGSAHESFGIHFDIYDVDKLNICKQQKTPYSRGALVDCDSLGTLITALRDKSGLSLENLCHGICDKSTLFRIENGEMPGNIYILEALMQRLGRDVNILKDFFLSTDDFKSMQLRDRIDELLIVHRCGEAEVLLGELESMSSFVKYRVNEQFIKMAKALICDSKSKTPPPEFPKMLIDALAITYKNFTERFIERHPLTYTEAFIINAYAGYYKDIGEVKRASDIYERLLCNLKENYVDECAKTRMFSAAVLNYSSCLGILERREEALEEIEDCMSLERSHQRLTMLPGLSYNKGYNLFKLGFEKESLPHFVLAYYSARMFAPYDNVKAMGASITRRFVQAEFGLTLS